jgi:hypothetical protein
MQCDQCGGDQVTKAGRDLAGRQQYLYRPRIQTLGGLPVRVMENAAPHRMSHAA